MEIRQIRTSTDLNGYLNFPYVAQVACVERYVEHLKTGKKHFETVYLITSLSPGKASPERLLAINRGHWSIENRDHYVRDVTFDEDRSQIRTGSAPRVMATMRKLTIGILRMAGHKNIAKAARLMVNKPHLALAMLKL